MSVYVITNTDEESKIANAYVEERNIVFPALMHWPKDKLYQDGRYEHVHAYKVTREICINHLFTLLSRRWVKNEDVSKSFSLVEIQAAEAICKGLLKSGWNNFFSDLDGYQSKFLQVLHISYSLGFDSYCKLRNEFLDLCKSINAKTLRGWLNSPRYSNALFVQVNTGSTEDLKAFIDEKSKMVMNQKEHEYSEIRLWLLRRLYHESFEKSEWLVCYEIAREARLLSTEKGDPRIVDVFDESGVRPLTSKYWHYLELISVIYLDTDDKVTLKAQLESLLSVDDPESYFQNEADFKVLYWELDSLDEWFEYPYYQEIFENGAWIITIENVLKAASPDQLMTNKAANLIKKLKVHPLLSVEEYEESSICD